MNQFRTALLFVAITLVTASSTFAQGTTDREDRRDPCPDLTAKVNRLGQNRTDLRRALSVLAVEEKSLTAGVLVVPLIKDYSPASGAVTPNADFPTAMMTKQDMEAYVTWLVYAGAISPLEVAPFVQLVRALTSKKADAISDVRGDMETAVLRAEFDLKDAIAERDKCRAERAKTTTAAPTPTPAPAAPVSGWVFKELRPTERFTSTTASAKGDAAGGSITVVLDGNYREICPGSKETATFNWTLSNGSALNDGDTLTATLTAAAPSSGPCKGGLAGRARMSMAVSGTNGLTESEAKNVEGSFSWAGGAGSVMTSEGNNKSSGAILFTDLRKAKPAKDGLAWFTFTVAAPDGTGIYTVIFERAAAR